MVTLVFVQYNQRMVNTFHVRCGGAPTAADLLAIKNVFQNWDRNAPTVATNLCTFRALNASLVQISLMSLHVAGGPVLDYVLPTQSAGTQNVNYPSYMTIAVKWTTALSGRNNRGRSFHVGVHTGPAPDGLITIAQATLLQACYARLPSDLTAAGYTLVVASKYEGVEIVGGYRRGIPRIIGITTPITGVGVERGLDT